MHYVLSKREDSGYWRDNANKNSIPESLSEKVELWRWQGPYHKDTMHVDEMFPSASYQYILYGMGFKTNIGLSTKQSEVQTSKVAQELFDENFLLNLALTKLINLSIFLLLFTEAKTVSTSNL